MPRLDSRMYARGIWAQNVAIVNTKCYIPVSAPAIWLMGLPNLFRPYDFIGRRAPRQIPYRNALRRHDLHRRRHQRRRADPFFRAGRCHAGHAGPCRARAGVPARQPRRPHPLHHAAHRRTPPGRPVRGEGAPDNAGQALYLGGVRGHLVGASYPAHDRRRCGSSRRGERQTERGVEPAMTESAGKLKTGSPDSNGERLKPE